MILWLQLQLCLVVVVVGYGGYFLSRYGDIIGEKTGLSMSLIGLMLLATVTSLPELVTGITAITAADAPEIAVTLSTLRIGAIDMTIANLLGSNLLYIAIPAVDDLFYTKGPMLAHVNSNHAFTVFTAVTMNALVIVGLVFRPQGRAVLGLTWVSLDLFLLYILNTWILFEHEY